MSETNIPQDRQPLSFKIDPDRQAWLVFTTMDGREALVNINNIILGMSSAGITRNICVDALHWAFEENQD
jgi:hypothetical protein